MTTPPQGELLKDVLTLRISHLSRSAEVRQFVVDAMNNGDDPFDLPDHTIGGVSIDMVADEPDVFAGKLDQLLGNGAGDAYLQDAEQLSAPYLTDTLGHRQHLWDWWKERAGANSVLAAQIRKALLDTMSQGSAVAFTGDYSGNHLEPEVVASPDAQGDPLVRFRTDDVPHIEKP